MPANDSEILIYAAGAGWGHLNRALSLAFKVASKYKARIISSSKHAKHIMCSSAWIDHSLTQRIKLEDLSALDSASFSKQVQQIFLEKSYECSVIDTFPRGLLGELAELRSLQTGTAKVLIHRDINPDYVAKFEIEKFAANNFDLIINPGERTELPLAHLCVKTAPWLLKDANELPSRQSVRAQTGVTDNETPFVLICASGKDDEEDYYIELTRQIARRYPGIALRCLIARDLPNEDRLFINHWPGIDYICAADILIGAGGYNTINECEALKIPLLAMPQGRLYDR
ncbi:MAG: hypothetical protein K2X81_03815, partial [Candidatus Obscuribacterales bacterium]|nr:hypothetical protein [Candidatus Obscuribacterales bacterium]